MRSCAPPCSKAKVVKHLTSRAHIDKCELTLSNTKMSWKKEFIVVRQIRKQTRLICVGRKRAEKRLQRVLETTGAAGQPNQLIAFKTCGGSLESVTKMHFRVSDSLISPRSCWLSMLAFISIIWSSEAKWKHMSSLHLLLFLELEAKVSKLKKERCLWVCCVTLCLMRRTLES